MINFEKINQLIQQNKFLDAQKLIKNLLNSDERNQDLLLLLAGIYRSLGKFDKAKETYFKITQIDETNTTAHRLLIDYLEKDDIDNYEKKLVEIKSINISDKKKVELFFSLGILNEKKKNFKISANYFIEANKLKRKIVPFNFINLQSHFENLKIVFEKLNFDKKKFQNQKKIIFIIGLPRSGTSLVESILGANKNIYSAGEIPNLKKIIRDNFTIDGSLNYEKIIQSANNEKTDIYKMYINHSNLKDVNLDIITDKNTENFKFLGLINIFFENAKIINCIRDPFENFCSLYKTNFNSSALNWTNSMKEISLYHKNYFQLINLWKKKNIKNIIDIKFEELLSNPEDVIEKLIDFCDLDTNYNYKDFYKLITSPIKTASANQARNPINKNYLFKYKKFKDYFDFN